MDVPKNYFCQTLWSICELNQIKFFNEFVPIISNLRTFGDIKYFFDHNNFIRMTWSILTASYI
jgi:hypothetical protein